jgi:hypothetical protein
MRMRGGPRRNSNQIQHLISGRIVRIEKLFEPRSSPREPGKIEHRRGFPRREFRREAKREPKPIPFAAGAAAASKPSAPGANRSSATSKRNLARSGGRRFDHRAA